MAKPHLRPTPLTVATATLVALAAAPAALASEPSVPAGPPPPAALVLPVFVPLPSPAGHAQRPSLRRVRVVPRRIRRGRQARVRLTLSAPARLRIVVRRRAGGRLVVIRRLTLDAAQGAVSIRLPRRVRGHALKAGRYRVSVVAVDAAGNRSATVHRALLVRRRAG